MTLLLSTNGNLQMMRFNNNAELFPQQYTTQRDFSAVFNVSTSPPCDDVHPVMDDVAMSVFERRLSRTESGLGTLKK